MKNKKILVFGLVMILTAIVASTAFAYHLKGVTWSVDKGGSSGYTMYLYNNNDYKIYFRTSIGQAGSLDAYKEMYINCFQDTTLSEVKKW